MKKTRSWGALCVLLLLCYTSFAQGFQQHTNGITIRPLKAGMDIPKAIKLTVVSDKIIRVTASPTDSFPTTESLSVIPQTAAGSFLSTDGTDSVELKTKFITARVSKATGQVSFTDNAGQPIIKQANSCRPLFAPFVVDGQPLYHISQSFETFHGEAFYGLGQHQEGTMNHRNDHVTLLQQNTDVAVPFMVSSSNYGLLWDNYSISSFGDCREPAGLSALGLEDMNGIVGALTASYYYKRNNAADSIIHSRREAGIDYAYLDDQKDFPPAFNLGRSIVTWEGNLTPNTSGDHTLKLYEGGYCKVWVDGKLLYDSWRQSWNPAFAKLVVPMEAGKKYPIKVWWDPDGGESYISLKWLGPVPEDAKNKFAFNSEAGKQLDYYFICGSNMDEVISGYRQLTGKATMMPQWAYGFWQSRERYKTQQELLDAVAEFRKRHIGLDNIVQDWSYWKEDQWGNHDFDASRFPDPAGMIKTLHDQYHVQLMISVWPKFYTNTAYYKEMNDQVFLYKRNVDLGRRDWIGKGYTSTFYDAFNPGARKLFWKQMNEKLYKLGVDAWWMDASEPDIHSNVNIEDRKDFMNPTALGTSTEYFNGYALENAKGIYEGQRATNPNDRVFILTRSGFAGLQRFAAATWSGDIGSRWRDLKTQIAAGTNFSMSGLPNWTMDIGGFAVERRYENPTPENKAEWQELQTRWYQFGTFVPIFRSHGQFPFREIYNIAPEEHPAYKSMLYYNKLRYRLMPYIYSLAGMTYQNDYTIMRGLVMDFAKDKQTWEINDQFMFGPAFLVNPVHGYKATSRKLYLPGGVDWYDAYSGKSTKGGQTITADAPYERMPLFIKGGSIIPMGPEIEYTGQKPVDTLTVFVYAGADGKFDLYEDEGTNYNYEKGAFSTIPMTWNNTANTFTVGKRNGSFTGIINKRTFRLVLVDPTHPQALDANAPAVKIISYSGKAVSVKLK